MTIQAAPIVSAFILTFALQASAVEKENFSFIFFDFNLRCHQGTFLQIITRIYKVAKPAWWNKAEKQKLPLSEGLSLLTDQPILIR